MLDPSCQAQRHTLKERKDDVYETPDVAVHALMRAEHLPPSIWEPACGPGRIVNVLRSAGHRVYATDLVDHNCPDSESRVDFLMARSPEFHIGAIVTNPPFKLAAEFVAHALTLCPKVIMLMRLAFLESDRRTTILEGGHLARVHVFRNRLPMMHRAGWDGNRVKGGAMAFAWFVWDLAKPIGKPTELHRLSWVPA